MKWLVPALVTLLCAVASATPKDTLPKELSQQLWKAFNTDVEVRGHRSQIQKLIFGQTVVDQSSRDLRLIRQNCGFVGCTETYLATETYKSREGQANPMQESILALIYVGFAGDVESVEVIFPQVPPES